jgi:hypothetical protein
MGVMMRIPAIAVVCAMLAVPVAMGPSRANGTAAMVPAAPPAALVPAAPPAMGATSAIARKWVDALGNRDTKVMVDLARYPFALRNTGKEGDCKNSTASNASKMKVTIGCLVKDDLLIEDIKANPEPEAKVLSKKTLPAWSRRWAKEISTDATPVSVFIHGNGSSHEFIVLVVSDGVQGFWKTAWFESN